MRVERQVLFWLAALLAVVLALLALKDVLLPFLIGIVIAYALNPLADRLSRIGINRAVASGLIVAALIVVIVVLLVFLVPLLANQLQQMGLSLPGEEGAWTEDSSRAGGDCGGTGEQNFSSRDHGGFLLVRRFGLR